MTGFLIRDHDQATCFGITRDECFTDFGIAVIRAETACCGPRPRARAPAVSALADLLGAQPNGENEYCAKD
jgi:hypothetical protein